MRVLVLIVVEDPGVSRSRYQRRSYSQESYPSEHLEHVKSLSLLSAVNDFIVEKIRSRVKRGPTLFGRFAINWVQECRSDEARAK
jgi:hypothetical protein